MRLNRSAGSRETSAPRAGVKQAIRLALLAILIFSPVMATHIPAAAAQESGVPSGNVIVVLRDQVQLAEATSLAGEVGASVTFGAVLNGFAANLTPEEAAELADDPRVAAIYPDLPIYLTDDYTDALGVRRVGAPAGHLNLSEGVPPATNATVAVIDSGVSLSHPNLNVVAGFDAWAAGNPESGAGNCGALTPEEKVIFEDDGPNTWGAVTNNSHGSQVAGAIGARGLNNVVGMAPGANIVAVKVFDSSGGNTTAKTLCALAWVHANKAALGIDVVNMSLVWPVTAGPCDSDPNHQAICTVVNGGLPIVAANGNSDQAGGPMNTYPELIAVSSFNDWDGRSGGLATQRPANPINQTICTTSQAHTADDLFSTFNQAGASDYIAPGACIWTTTTNGYNFASGSSFAAPHVTGAIALYAATNQSPSDAAARAYLDGVSVPISDPDGIIGAGGGGARVLRLGPSPVFGHISPESGAPGAKIAFLIGEFPSDAVVTITWKRTDGGTIALGTTTTNSSGIASGEITVPDTAPGGPGQEVVFTVGTYTAAFEFETRPRIRFHEPTAAPGGTVLANGRGFAKNDTLTVKWRNGVGQFVTIGTVNTNSNGNFTNLSLTVPEWAPIGTNTVRMEGVLNQNTSSLTVITPGVQISPIRTTVNNKINYDLSNFPPDTTVSITWTRLTGSTIDMGTLQTDEAGNASGQITVPATPGGPGQLITFAGGGVSETVTFEVAPRIKSNTAVAQRGGQADISLRGFARQETYIIRWRNPETGVWVTLGSGTTSNTGSANFLVTVPAFAPDGPNSVRAESPSFNQQTNVVEVLGGVPFNPAGEDFAPTPTPEPEETPSPIPTEIDTSALPLTAPLTIEEITDDAEAPNLRIALTDGQVQTTWSAAPDPVRQDARLVIELGGAHQVSGLAWLTETGGCGELAQVEYSNDGENWLPIDPFLIPGEIGEPMVWRFFGANVEATHLRITIGQAEPDQNPLGCIAEVRVWGTVIESPEPEPTPTEEPPVDIEEPTPTEDDPVDDTEALPDEPSDTDTAE